MDVQKIVEVFVAWTKKKIQHDIEFSAKEKYFREKEIWWAALGKNIGYETDGKHDLFERPVLILKKYSPYMCFILPISTKIKKERPWYQIYTTIDEEIRSVNISQGRVISVKRLLRKKSQLDHERFIHIRIEFLKQFE